MAWSVLWKPTSAAQSVLIGNGDDTTITGSRFLFLTGTSVRDTNDEDAGMIVPMGGTFKSLYVELSGDAGASASYTFTIRNVTDASDTAITCTITGGSDDFCNDTSNTVQVGTDTNEDVGDIYTLSVTESGTGAAVYVWYGIVFQSDTDGEFIIAGVTDNALNASSTEFNGPQNADTSWSGTESSRDQPIQGVASGGDSLKALYVHLSAAPGTSGDAYTFTLNDATSATALSCQVLNTATTCNDTGETVNVADDNFLSMESAPAVTPATPDARYSILAFIDPGAVATRRVMVIQ